MRIRVKIWHADNSEDSAIFSIVSDFVGDKYALSLEIRRANFLAVRVMTATGRERPGLAQTIQEALERASVR